MIGALASLLIAAAQPAAPAASDAGSCTRVSPAEIAASLDAYIDRCVIVERMGVRSRLYTDRESLYDRGAVGPVVYIGLVDPAGGELDDPAFVRVVGRATTCREVRLVAEREKREIPPICEALSRTKAVVMVSERTVDRRRRYERLVGEEHRTAHGSLIVPPADWDSVAHVLRTTEAFRRALVSRDAATLKRLHVLPDPELAPYLLDDPAIRQRPHPARPVFKRISALI